jgi:hypothetical protein
MTYRSYDYYCHACKKTIHGALGVPSHRRGKEHRENVIKAKKEGRAYWIERQP